MTKSSSSSPSKAKVSKAFKTTAKAPKKKVSKAKGGSSDKKAQIYRYICEQHAMGITEVDKLQLAFGVGNKNPRSEGFAKSLKELISDDGLVKAGSTKDSLALTDKGINAMPDDLDVTNDPSKMHDQYIEFIKKEAKAGFDKVRPLWEILLDFKPHAINDISETLGYTNPRSFGNTKIVAAMKKMGLVENVGKGSIQFTDKVPKVMSA